MRGQIHGAASEHDAPTLDRLNEVFGTLGHETEPCLMRVELQNSSERLLRHYRKIVGVIQEHPGHRASYRANTAYELCQTLADGGNSAIVGRTQTECHRGMVRGAHTLRI